MSTTTPSRSLPGSSGSTIPSPDPASRAGRRPWALRRVENKVAALPWEGWLAALAVATFGQWQRDPLDGAEALFLAHLVAWVLTFVGLAFSAAGASKRPLIWSATACVAVIWIVHQGPHRGAAMGLCLLVATLHATWVLLSRPTSPNPENSSEPALALWRRGLVWTSLAAAWLGLLHSADWVEPWAVDRVLYLILLPVGLGAAAVLLERRLTPPVRRLAAGLGPIALAALGLATLPTLYPWLRPEPLNTLASLPGAGPAAVLIAFLVFMGFLTARSGAGSAHALNLALATAAVASLMIPAQRTEVLSEGLPKVLIQKRPILAWTLEPGALRAVVVETDLVHGAELEPGSSALRVLWRQGDATWHDEFLHSGVDMDDWASGRQDLASRPGRPAVPAWHHRVLPGGPDDKPFAPFFSRTFRSVVQIKLPAEPPGSGSEAADQVFDPTLPTTVVLQRPKALPADVQIRLHRVEIRR